MNILILYTPREKTPNKESISDNTVQRISDCLQSKNYVVNIAQYSPFTIRQIIKKYSPDLIFHLAYGYVGGKIFEEQPYTTLRLEKLGQHTIGSNSAVQFITQDKLTTANLLDTVGILSPRLIDPKEEVFSENVILKPRTGSCHRDIKVFNRLQIGPLFQIPDTMLLQEFIDGPEFTVCVLETPDGIEVLPPLGIEYDKTNKGLHYMDWQVCRWSYFIDENDTFNLKRFAAKVFTTLKMFDYGRFDFRIKDRIPILLDANSLPNLHPEISLFPLCAALSRIPYCDLINKVVNNAINRLKYE